MEWDGGDYKEVKERCGVEFDCYNGFQTGEDHREERQTY